MWRALSFRRHVHLFADQSARDVTLRTRKEEISLKEVEWTENKKGGFEVFGVFGVLGVLGVFGVWEVCRVWGLGV